MTIESKGPNDCAIVACSTYLGIPYDDVKRAFFMIALDNHIVWNCHKGTPTFISSRFMANKGLTKCTTIPRRGQDRISGIVSMHSAGAKSGHMVTMINGTVFDAFVPEGMLIKEYQSRFCRSHIRCIWK